MFLGWYRTWTDGPAVTPPVVVVTTPTAGGVRRRRKVGYLKREFIIGNEKFTVETDGELERVLVEAITEEAPPKLSRRQKQRRVNLEPRSEIVPLAPIEFRPINWDVVERLREQSRRMEQAAVLEALDRLIARRRAWEEDERDVELLLLN